MFGFDKLCRGALANAAAVLAAAIFFLPASAQPEAQSVYLVFFDFEVPGLTAAASDVVALAVKAAVQKNAKVIYVVGHADGSEHHPEHLSFKRALEVRRELKSRGLPDTITVSVEGRGFYKPLIATNEREPQNRLVGIYISEPPPEHSADAATAPGSSAAQADQGAGAPTAVSSPPVPDGFYLVLEDGSSDAGAVTIPDAAPNAPALRLRREPLVPGGAVRHAEATSDAVGRTTVDIELTQSGGELMAAATSKNVGRRLAIVVGGAAISVPTIQTPITGGRVEVSGAWTLSQANAFVGRLQALGTQ